VAAGKGIAKPGGRGYSEAIPTTKSGAPKGVPPCWPPRTAQPAGCNSRFARGRTRTHAFEVHVVDVPIEVREVEEAVVVEAVVRRRAERGEPLGVLVVFGVYKIGIRDIGPSRKAPEADIGPSRKAPEA
jgi:hypothetical protein